MSSPFDEPLIPKFARDSLFALITTFLALGSQDIEDYANVPIVDSLRYFDLTGELLDEATKQGIETRYNVGRRVKGDFALYPGVSVFFGDDTPARDRAKPQHTYLPFSTHTCVKYGKNRTVSDAIAQRISYTIADAFEGLGASLQVYDLRTGTPVAIPHRKVSWAHYPRPASRDVSEITDQYTNRITNFEARFAR